MKNKKYEKELFKDFQAKANLYGDIIVFEKTIPVYWNVSIIWDFFAFVLVEGGTGTHTIDQVAYPVGSLQIHIIFPGQRQCWNLDGQVNIHMICVSPKKFGTMEDYFVYPIEYYKLNPILKLDRVMFYKILHEVSAMKAELLQQDVMNEIVLSRFRIITMMTMREMIGKVDRETYGKSEALFTKFSMLVMTYYRESRKVGYYAGKLGVSANYLNIICKKHIDMTANSFIAKEVLNEVKHEMMISKKSVKEISFELKFNDIAGFSNYFKRHMGISPRNFANILGLILIDNY